MDDDQLQDELQETTTGTGRLLFMFLAMVLLCAVFFGLGYSLGRTSGPSVTQAAEPAQTATTGGAKPSPLNADDSSQPSSGQLTFYDTVSKDAPAAAAKPAATKPSPAAPLSEEARLAAAVGMTPVTTTAPPPAPAAPGYNVQIAAVTRREDANALVKALSKKHYPAFIATSQSDKFLRVQVGPFSDLKEAEAMKARLVGDGYKPIVKK